jgi:hypothetical protein
MDSPTSPGPGSSSSPAAMTPPDTATARRPHAQQLEDDFIDRFAVTGPAKEVGERLAALAALGLERIVVVPGSLDADPANLAESNARFAADVLPELRGL